MKTRLLLSLLLVLPFVGANAQNQKLWALAKTGGASSGGTIVAMNNDGSGLSIAYSFDWTYGASPMGNLLLASDGNLYGTCYDGGAFASCVIFRYAPATDTYTDIYDFDITNGDFPQSGVVEGGNGKLYGASSAGGTSYAGVIYSIDKVTLQYTPEFSFNNSNGTAPIGAPILFGNMLYGMTSAGGPLGNGVMYAFNLSNNGYTILHSFNGTSDGGTPYGSLLLASDGKFYGMCAGGGNFAGGTLFSYEPISGTFSVLHHFTAATGQTPYASVFEASNGKLYGTASDGGTNGSGVIFSYDRSTGIYTDEYNFTFQTGDYPASDLSQDNNGMIYGTASSGGYSSDGTMFRFDPVTHALTVMMNFSLATTGSAPNGGVLITSSALGINDPSSTTSAIAVYPNPADGVVHISGSADGTTSYQLSNIAGETVLSWESGLNDQSIDISILSPGIYFLQAVNGEMKEVRKISVR